jgi:hypothetical protein
MSKIWNTLAIKIKIMAYKYVQFSDILSNIQPWTRLFLQLNTYISAETIMGGGSVWLHSAVVVASGHVAMLSTVRIIKTGQD